MKEIRDIHWSIIRLDELTGPDTFQLFRLRVDTFVVEQRCAYPELDDADLRAWHVLGRHVDGRLAACARIIPPEVDGLPHVGRIVVHPAHRGKGIAHQLMRECLGFLNKTLGRPDSALAAQAQLQDFYGKYGYQTISAQYDWDGIPHVDMELRSPSAT